MMEYTTKSEYENSGMSETLRCEMSIHAEIENILVKGEGYVFEAAGINQLLLW